MKQLLFLLMVALPGTFVAQPINMRPRLYLISTAHDSHSLGFNFYKINTNNDTTSFGLYLYGCCQWNSDVIVSEEEGLYLLVVMKGNEKMVIRFETEASDMKTKYYKFGFSSFTFRKGCYRFNLTEYLNSERYEKSGKKIKLRYDGSDGLYRSPDENMLDLSSVPLDDYRITCAGH